MKAAVFQSWRLILIGFAGCAAFGAIFWQLGQLHLVRGPALAASAEDARRSLVPLEARRGDIRDSRGVLLAGTRPHVVVGIDPAFFRDEDLPKLPELARILRVDPAEVKRAATTRYRSEGGRPIRWVRLGQVDDATYDAALALRVRGFYGTRGFERHYPAESLAAQILGFINREGVAVMGVEQQMDFYLRGQPGWRISESDGRRRELAAFRVREAPPVEGFNVVLTIDSVVQSMVEAEIRALAEQFSPDGISIIVTEARTGAVLAMANYPTFDPNRFWEFPLENQRNRAVTDSLEPGSTFKIVPVAAALEERLLTPETLIHCSLPVVQYAGRSVRLPSDVRELGEIPLTTVVARSSNRGAAMIGMMLGSRRLHDYSALFGFGSRTNWPLGGEIAGRLHPVERWDGLTISRLPAGYAVSATPLQIHMATATLANGGLRQQPFLLSRVVDRSGANIMHFEPRAPVRVVSEETARTMADLLATVVSPEGTARRAALPGIRVAGKTGTSRKIIDGRYSRTDHFASFTGFFPAEAPELVVTVIVDNPRSSGVGFGGVVAAPAFRNIAEGLVRYFAIEAPRPDAELARFP